MRLGGTTAPTSPSPVDHCRIPIDPETRTFQVEVAELIVYEIGLVCAWVPVPGL